MTKVRFAAEDRRSRLLDRWRHVSGRLRVRELEIVHHRRDGFRGQQASCDREGLAQLGREQLHNWALRLDVANDGGLARFRGRDTAEHGVKSGEALEGRTRTHRLILAPCSGSSSSSKRARTALLSFWLRTTSFSPLKTTLFAA